MIPKDILEEIALKLSPLELEWMCQVCQHWKSILKSEAYMRKPSKGFHDLPWLLLPQDPYCDHISFYGLSNGQVYRIQLPKRLQGGRCCGTSKGWLLIVTGLPSTWPLLNPIPGETIPHLWNPVSGETISLPSLKTMPNFNLLFAQIIYDYGAHSVIRRIEVISVGSDQLIAAAIFGLVKQNLGFCRPQEREWTILEGIEIPFTADILFHKGKFYVLTTKSSQEGIFLIKLGDCELLRLVLINVNPSLHLFQAGFPMIPTDKHHPGFLTARGGPMAMSYLAESTRGELLLISRIFDTFEKYPTAPKEYPNYSYYQTTDFIVEVINFEPGTYLPIFTKLRSLGNEALFVASSGSLSHSTPEIDTNCIYFLADQLLLMDGPIISRDSGVFHVQGCKVKRSFPSMRFPIQSSIGWFIPKLPKEY